jgi:hypothetical protein
MYLGLVELSSQGPGPVENGLRVATHLLWRDGVLGILPLSGLGSRGGKATILSAQKEHGSIWSRTIDLQRARVGHRHNVTE